MDVFEVRRENLKNLIKQKFDGNRAAFCRAIGKNPNLINLLLTKNPDYQRNIGEKLARDIEHGMSLPQGWLDESSRDKMGSKPYNVLRSATGTQTIHLDSAYCEKYLPISVDVARYLVAADDSMSPAINPGDHVVINPELNNLKSDGVYCFVSSDRVYMRRMQSQLNGKVLASCDNPAYKPVELLPKDLKSLEIIGKAVAVLRCTPI